MTTTLDSRQQLEEALGEILPDDFKIVTNPNDFDNLAASVAAAVQFFRRGIKPTEYLGRFNETYELWIIEPTLAIDADATETRLDGLLAQTIDALQEISWLAWNDGADRVTHKTGRPAYRFTITLETITTETD